MQIFLDNLRNDFYSRIFYSQDSEGGITPEVEKKDKRLRLTEIFPETKRLVNELAAWSEASRNSNRRVGQSYDSPRYQQLIGNNLLR